MSITYILNSSAQSARKALFETYPDIQNLFLSIAQKNPWVHEQETEHSKILLKFKLNNSTNRNLSEVNDDIVDKLNRMICLYPQIEFVIDAGLNPFNLSHAPEKKSKRTCFVIRNRLTRKRNGFN